MDTEYEDPRSNIVLQVTKKKIIIQDQGYQFDSTRTAWFHTYGYARHFFSACTRILGLEGTPDGVEDQGRLTRVAVFPIGIDSVRFMCALELPQVQEHIEELKERFAGRKKDLLYIFCKTFYVLLYYIYHNMLL
ncbi:hypothetical protein UlMin_000420 [Ulmus minor]